MIQALIENEEPVVPPVYLPERTWLPIRYRERVRVERASRLFLHDMLWGDTLLSREEKERWPEMWENIFGIVELFDENRNGKYVLQNNFLELM